MNDNNIPDFEEYMDSLSAIQMKQFWNTVGKEMANDAMEQNGSIVYLDNGNIVRKYKDGTIETIKKAMTATEFRAEMEKCCDSEASSDSNEFDFMD